METLQNLFPGDSYDTPEDYPRCLDDRLLLGCRAPFYIRNFYVFYRCGVLCKAKLFGPKEQVQHSIWNFRITEGCGGRIHLRGLDNLSRFDGPAVIVGNHMSLLETGILHAFVRPRRDFAFVIKRSLFDVPYFGELMRTLESIPVDRVNPKDDFKTVMEEGRKMLEKGKSVVIFPQSTRSPVFDPSQFNSIGLKLAKHAGVPVIPFAIRTDFLQNGRFFKDLGPIVRSRPIWFEFAEPIMKIEGTGKAEQARIVEFIKDRVLSWGGAVASSPAAEAKPEA